MYICPDCGADDLEDDDLRECAECGSMCCVWCVAQGLCSNCDQLSDENEDLD